MRKSFLILIILSLLFINAGCSNPLPDNSIDEPTAEETSLITDVHFFETEWSDIDLDPTFPVDLENSNVLSETKPINTNQTATEVATTIITNLHKQGSFLDYILVGIVHSTEDNIWRFEYSIDHSASIAASLTEGGGFYVAINGNDGSIIQAWVEE